MGGYQHYDAGALQKTEEKPYHYGDAADFPDIFRCVLRTDSLFFHKNQYPDGNSECGNNVWVFGIGPLCDRENGKNETTHAVACAFLPRIICCISAVGRIPNRIPMPFPLVYRSGNACCSELCGRISCLWQQAY